MEKMMMKRRALLGGAIASAGAVAAMPARAVLSAAPARWDIETDVVVLGCGAAGLMAAVQAASGGARVEVFDKGLSPYHTSTRLNGGCFAACGTKIQKANGVKDTPEAFARNISEYGDGFSLMAPVLTYAKNSGAAFDWLQDHGLAEGMWQPYNGHTTARTVRQKTYNGKDYIDALMAEVKRRGLAIHHGCGLVRFIRDEKGRVIGVECGRGEKRVLARARKGVVMATGGITGSAQEVARWSPVLSDAVTIGGGANDGEALRIAVRDLGALLTHMQYFAEYPYALPIGRGRGPQLRFQYFVDEGAMLVDKKGARFVKETLAPTQISPSMERNEGQCMFVVMNEAMFERAAKKYPFGALLSSPQWTRARWEKELAAGRVVFQGATLKEAAEKAGVDAAGLEKQVALWNGYVDAGKDPDFGRTGMKTKLEGGPYLIARVGVWVCLSMGGLKVNERLQPLGWDEKPIEGLYAAGETVGGVHGAHYLGGDACGFAHTSGYVAGRLLTGQTVEI